MPKRSSKRPDPDANEIAYRIVQQATGQQPKDTPSDQDEDTRKNPAAVALGRLGGLKGGKARAAKLSAKRRREIAKKAAMRRWRKKAG